MILARRSARITVPLLLACAASNTSRRSLIRFALVSAPLLAFHETGRFVKRLYVPLPDKSGRRQLMNILLKTSPSSLTPADVEEVVENTEGETETETDACALLLLVRFS